MGELDVFICHASEDKSDVARPLAEAFEAAGLKVWYDEYSLRVGDSLRRAIESGLSQARFGVVILSQHFFAKNWPQAELDALFDKEMQSAGTILPVWHGIEADEVRQRARLLIGKFAARTAHGLDRVIEQLLDVLQPGEAHRTTDSLTVSVHPPEFDLHKGLWTVKTPVIISNRSRRDLFAVWIRATFDKTIVTAESVDIQPGQAATGLEGDVGGVSFGADIIRIDGTDAAGREAVWLLVHTLKAHHSRELVISGTRGVRSRAIVRVLSFKTEPDPIQEQAGKAALPFTPPEQLTFRAITALLRGRQE